MEVSTPSDPPDKVVMEDQHGDDHYPLPKVNQSFREVVASSTQWFSEARIIITASKDWDESEELAPEEDLALQFKS